MPTAWTVKDNKGHLLPHIMGGSRMDVGRKVVPRPYDAFRLEVSASYREAFDRDLNKVLERKDWQIVPVKERRRSSRPWVRRICSITSGTQSSSMQLTP